MNTSTAVLAAYGLLDKGYAWESATVLCPFHGERTPSLSFNLEEGVFFCFGCRESGSILDFIAKFERVSSLEALRIFVQMTRVTRAADSIQVSAPIEAAERASRLKDAYAHYASSMPIDWRWAGDHYLIRRGYKPRTLAHFGARLSQVSTHAIVLPIMEGRRFRGYVARRPDEEGTRKYLFNKGFPRASTVDGQLVPGPVAVVEGKLDQMRAWQYGYPNVACLFGAAVTAAQVKKLARVATVLYSWLDNDEAGRAGHVRLAHLAQPYDLEVVRPIFPPGVKDVGEMGFAQFMRFAYLPEQDYFNP